MSVYQDVMDWLCRYCDGDGTPEPFLLSVHNQGHDRGRLSPKQIDAVLRWRANMEGRKDMARSLWRDTLMASHPDLATDPGDQRWRERFTKLANLAYESEDIPKLTWLRELVAGEVR